MLRAFSAKFHLRAIAAGVILLVIHSGCERPPKPQPAAGDKAPDKSPSTDPVAAREKTPPADAGKSTQMPVDEAAKRPSKAEKFADWPKPAVALVLTGQLMGYIEPCGCSGLENQKGGLARRHTLLRLLAEERGWDVVPLDVGNQVKSFGKEQELKFTSVIQGLRTMGYRALTLGDGDLRLTPGEILASIAGNDGTTHDVIGSNVAVLARELQPRSLVHEVAGLKIGVTAVLGEKYEARLRGDEIVHELPRDGLKAATEELQSQKCDFLVLLAHASLDEARKLAQEQPVFDLVVASGETSLPSHELEEVKGTKTRLMQVGQKAMYAGIVGILSLIHI